MRCVKVDVDAVRFITHHRRIICKPSSVNVSRGDPPAIHFFRLFLVSRMMNERRCSVEDLRVEIMSRAENCVARCLYSIQAPLQSIHDEAGWLASSQSR